MEDETAPHTFTWDKLTIYLSQITKPQFLIDIISYPITSEFIDDLVNDKWIINFPDWFLKLNPKEFSGKVSDVFKEISIHPNCTPYQRDVTLFHAVQSTDICHP